MRMIVSIGLGGEVKSILVTAAVGNAAATFVLLSLRRLGSRFVASAGVAPLRRRRLARLVFRIIRLLHWLVLAQTRALLLRLNSGGAEATVTARTGAKVAFLLSAIELGNLDHN